MEAKDQKEGLKEILSNLKEKNPLDSNLLRYILLSDYTEGSLGEWENLLYWLSSRVRMAHWIERGEGELERFVYRIDSENEVIIIGDIHGDIESLWKIVETEKIFSTGSKKVVFLGDYIDRGIKQLSTLVLPFILKVLNKNNIYLLRGNHDEWRLEGSEFSPCVRGGDELFIIFWKQYFKRYLLLELYELFQELPVVVDLNGKIGIAHSGIPRPTNNITRYDEIHSIKNLNDPDILYEMRWSRPEDKEDVIITGGSDFSVASVHFENFRKRLGWEMIIRGHDPVEDGYELLPAYKNRLLTIHSTGCPRNSSLKGPCLNTYFSEINPVYLKIKGNKVDVCRVYEEGKVIKSLEILRGVREA